VGVLIAVLAAAAWTYANLERPHKGYAAAEQFVEILVAVKARRG